MSQEIKNDLYGRFNVSSGYGELSGEPLEARLGDGANFRIPADQIEDFKRYIRQAIEATHYTNNLRVFVTSVVLPAIDNRECPKPVEPGPNVFSDGFYPVLVPSSINLFWTDYKKELSLGRRLNHEV